NRGHGHRLRRAERRRLGSRLGRHARACGRLWRTPGIRAAARRRIRAARRATAGPGTLIRVLLADDQSLVRAGFRMILNAEPDIEVVGEAGGGHGAVTNAGSLSPDVILMDIRMPDL